jgi:hypothetical protein
LERVRETIKRILFNQRQSEIIRAHEEQIYEEALASGELRISLGEEEPIAEVEVAEQPKSKSVKEVKAEQTATTEQAQPTDTTATEQANEQETNITK